MNIMGAIREKKAQFQARKYKKEYAAFESEKAKLEKQNRELAFQAQRSQEIEKLRAEQAHLKQVRGPSKMAKFGKGLANAMNKGKEGVAKIKSHGRMKGIQFGAMPSSGSRGLDTAGQGSPFGGQRNLEFGKPEPKKKERGKTIIIKT